LDYLSGGGCFVKIIWWRDKDNRDGAQAIVGVLKVLVPAALVAVVAVVGWLQLRPDPIDPDKPDPAKPSIQTGDQSTVQTGNGTLITAGDNAEISVVNGLSEETFLSMLNTREAQIRADLERVSTAEKAILKLQLNQITKQKQNIDEAYAQAVEELRLLRVKLEDFAPNAPRKQLEAAQKALFEGDRSLADQLLAKAEAENIDAVKVAAGAAFTRGDIAAQEIRWADAAEHYEKAARLDPRYDTLVMAGMFLQRDGKYGQAIRYSEDLVKLARREFGPKHSKTATSINNLATNYRAVGLYDDAEPLFREALEIDRKTLGTDHPDYAIDLNNLAGLLEATGRYDEAEPLYREALDIGRKTLGTDHPKYALRLNNLAALLEATGRYDEAELLFREALEIGRKTLGADHPDYATHLNNLAGLLEATGRYDEAEPHYREAVAVMEAALGAEHPNSLTLRGNLEVFLAEKSGRD
jgi:tetratricopeptide (TPR) repeat protein